MTFTEKMFLAKRLEEEISEIVSEVKRSLPLEVSGQPLNGKVLSDGKDGRPAMITISFSELAKSKNWTPCYYIPSRQGEAVEKKLSRCDSVSSVITAIREMLKEKRVKMGSGQNDFIYLNEKTPDILRSSEVGRYVAEYANEEN